MKPRPEYAGKHDCQSTNLRKILRLEEEEEEEEIASTVLAHLGNESHGMRGVRELRYEYEPLGSWLSLAPVNQDVGTPTY